MFLVDYWLEQLPQKPTLNLESEYYKTSVLVGFAKIENVWGVILEKRGKNIRQGGEISLPGGIFEADSDISGKDTAIRETIEELGIDRDFIEYLGELDSVIAPFGALMEVHSAIIHIEKLEKLNLSLNEVERVIFLPIKTLLNIKFEQYEVLVKVHPEIVDKNGVSKVIFPAKELGIPDRYQSPWGNWKQKIYLFKYDGEVIWGLTARVLKDVQKKLKAIESKSII
jgi:8-oxo-dGTP pyrophosphatase MutT (NUDIX family)